ncbi:MAG: recombination regulator RecX [Lachnospiraceae bacterium]|nr:recombination regulator RecX [Lachnospiraceae bacterium]
MKITKIKEISGKRFRIYLDEEPAFVLFKGELSSYGIEEDGELSEEAYSGIMGELLPKRAKMRAMKLLKDRPYTVRGLTDKLVEAEYPDSAVNEAISYVQSYGYLDDAKYAHDFVYTYKGRKNRMRIIAELNEKGVDRDLIEEALLDELGEDPEEYELAQIRKFLAKKNYDPETASFEEKQKILASICRRGYSPGLVKKAMEETL